MKQPIYITWLNPYGGFEYHLFTDAKDYSVDISETGQASNNIFPSYPMSYGQNADTIRKDIYRNSRNVITIRDGNLTKEKVTFLAGIKTSILVQIIVSRGDRRTITIDSDSFLVFSDLNKMHTVSFTAYFTDEIPVQTV